MSDKRYQVSVTIFTVKNFLNCADAAAEYHIITVK